MRESKHLKAPPLGSYSVKKNTYYSNNATSFPEFITLSHLFNTYCMNIYGSRSLLKYYEKNLLEVFYVAWRKSLLRVWKI